MSGRPFAAAVALSLAASGLAAPARAAPARTQLPIGAAPQRYELTLTPDAGRLTFTGVVRIALTLAGPTRLITLNAADLAVSRAQVDGRPARVTLDATSETASFTAGRLLAAGPHVLTVAYGGKIARRSAGLFAVDYASGAGQARMLLTQFEPADARRVLPCFDEPAYKAVFAVSAVVPAAQLAISNTPVAAREAVAGGLARVRFQPTPPMSPYLLFFGVGDLERVSRRVDGVDVGVVTPQGQTAQARFALDAAVQLLPFYDRWFGVRYPLPKLDLIAAPGEVGGAMENWGAILFSQHYAFIDPRISAASERHEVFDTVAHEMAHQWFGDLVTMGWWDDLWLNEGFATWMATKATQRFHPEWRPELASLSDKDGAMTVDARAGAHAIVQPVESVAQAEQAFDDITYQKGEAVLQMLEGYVGEGAFRAGVGRYIARHAFANARTDDLWAALDRVAGGPVSAIAHDFTTQTGVPLVRVEQGRYVRGASWSTLRQGRFQEGGPPLDVPRWRVPVRHLLLRGGAATDEILDGTGAIPGGEADLAVVNAGQAGYFRTAYAPALMSGLTRRIATLAPADQIGLLNDAAALGRSGDAPMAQGLELIAALPADAEPVVLRQAAAIVLALADLYPDDSPDLPAYKAWARRALAPWWARVGFDAQPGEAAGVGLLRERLIAVLSRMDDPAVIAEAERRFDLLRADPAALPAPIRRAVLRSVARHADARRFDQLHDMARAANGSLEKEQLYMALAVVYDDALVGKALAIAIGPEPPAHLGPGMVRTVAGQQPDLAWSFALAHEAALQDQLDALQRTTFLPSVAEESSDPARAAALEAYAAAHFPPDARKDAARAAADIRWKAELRATRLPQVIGWVAQKAEQPTPVVTLRR